MDNQLQLPDVDRLILVIRGQSVMLDIDLARIYGVSTRRLNEQVRRNRERFPEDFMFRLSSEEASALIGSRSQSATLKRGHNIKYLPHAFTENGAVMLSAVLKSPIAVAASIEIVRAFNRMRRIISADKEIARKLLELEDKVGTHDAQIQGILAAIRRLLEPPPQPPREIGFKP